MNGRYLFSLFLPCLLSSVAAYGAGKLSGEVALRNPGAHAKTYSLEVDADGRVSLANADGLSVAGRACPSADGTIDVDITVSADKTVYFNLALDYTSSSLRHEDCEFYMPGFWYHRNERSPENAPSFRISDSWQVREDRLSSPLAGVYCANTGEYMTVLRMPEGEAADCIVQNNSGDIILPGPTTVGFTGFAGRGGMSSLTFGFPYREAPKRYIRKLTLIDPVRAFEKLEPGQSVNLKWKIKEDKADDYSMFVSDTWNYTYDTLKPQPLAAAMSADEAKNCMADYFVQSYVDKYDLKYFSGEGLRTDNCHSTGGYQVGFVGRVLLNAFNAIEYGNATGRKDLVEKGESVFASVLDHGFTDEGYFLEAANLERGTKDDFLSIRRQSEGVFAMLNWLDYERRRGNSHPLWEARIRHILDKMVTLQDNDGSFPRKFDGSHRKIDASGGSTPSATLPLAMAYKYYNDKRYLEAARRTAAYLEHDIINKSDYFSSTLDADCEDKEAALYASTAMYYLTFVTKGKERSHYMDLCRRAAYFCLSWYYLWDVPFSQGQMLGDVGFKSRGWGNVSVENNHIDVFIFEFATILDHLADYYGEKRFSDFASVITGSMLQLMPVGDGCFDIGKRGYYPEVVQHTTWDYGRNGKGFYNDIFAPGWTVASLWQMLSPKRVETFFSKK